jgi:hypothetical protein
VDLYSLLLVLALAAQVGSLPLELFPWLRVIFDEMRRTAAIETTIVIVSLVELQKIRP